MQNEQLLFSGRAFRVVGFDVTDRDGRARRREVVRHPGAAAIVPWLPDGRVLLIRQPRPAIGRSLLEIPAGTRDGDEPPEACARRELAEETGYEAGTLRPLLRFHPSVGILDEAIWIFEARDLREGRSAPEDDEDISLVPVHPNEVAALVRSGEIGDAKTLLGLAAAGIHVPPAGF
ncbi:MAG: NUDIX hydrolase [Planctomycetales bacterium]|nr:NUDIX hydrolase [Planctomycetales bacterium]